MLSGNVKFAFNRLFLVVSIAWLFYAVVILPSNKVEGPLTRELAREAAEENACRDKASQGGVELSHCLKAGDDASQMRIRELSLKHVYATEWPEILTVSLGIPLLAYGAIRGIAAICLWIWHGYKPA